MTFLVAKLTQQSQVSCKARYQKLEPPKMCIINHTTNQVLYYSSIIVKTSSAENSPFCLS